MNNPNLSLEDAIAIDAITLTLTSAQCAALWFEIERFLASTDDDESIVLCPVRDRLGEITGWHEFGSHSDRVAFRWECTLPDDIMPRFPVTLSRYQGKVLRKMLDSRISRRNILPSILEVLTNELQSPSNTALPLLFPVDDTAIDPLWCHVVNPHSTL